MGIQRTPRFGQPVGTPFHERTQAASQTPFWYEWGPYQVVDIFTDFRQELKAMRRDATLNEMSPLNKYRFSGPDAPRLADRLITRDAVTQGVGQILYSPWCNEAGKIVGDGLIFRTHETKYIFVAGPSDEWFASNAAGMDVEIEDVTAEIGIMAVQGPKSPEVLQAATGEDVSDLRFSHIRRTEIGGMAVDVMRQGFTGERGYELWVDAGDAVAMWDALVDAGEPFGLIPAGEYAIDIARVEAGLLIIGADYRGGGPDPTMDNVDDPHARPPSPFEMRMGRFVDFGKDDFNGKQALLDEQAAGGPPLRMVGLEIDWKALVALQLEGAGVSDLMPRVSRDALPIVRDGRRVGMATSVTWGPSVGKLIGFGHIEKELEPSGTELSVQWPMGDELVTIGASVTDLPFLAHHRR